MAAGRTRSRPTSRCTASPPRTWPSTPSALTDGAQALLKKYPETFRIDVYPTRRSFAAPQWVYDNTFKNATRAKLVEGAGGPQPEGAVGGIPFPIPKNGAEAMWNHKLNWLSGTWRFCSGIDHADWVGVGGMVKLPGQERPDFRTCLVHKSDFQIDQDSWHVIGLSGTGSKDFTIADVFVPEHRSHSMIEAHLMLGQDRLPAWHRYPYWQIVNMAMASAIIGGAQGAIDEFQRQFAVRVNYFGAGKAADDPFVKSRLGLATMLVRGAAARVQTICTEMARCIDAGEAMSVATRLEWSAETAQCGKMCEDAVLLLFKASGARGLAVDNPIQAILRNVFGGSNHIAMNVDGVNSALGNLMLGRENLHVAC